MMGQMLDKCDCTIGIADYIILHGKDVKVHNKYLCKVMHIAHDNSFVLNPEKTVVKAM